MFQKKYVPLIAFLAGAVVTIAFSTYATDIGTNATITGSLFATSTVVATGNVLTFGKLGVGTTTPTAALAINAPGNVPGLLVGSSTATNFIVDKNGSVGIGSAQPRAQSNLDILSSGSTREYLRGPADQTHYLIFSDLTYGDLGWISANGSAASSNAYRLSLSTGATNGFITFNPGTGSEAMRIASSGNVGVGTTTPGSTFAVSSSATTTVQFGTTSSTQGSCLQLYTAGGTAYRVFIAKSGTLTAQQGACTAAH
ncbi:MAG: hypothetical protein HY268_20700 [Deltaproteobacteria bacterium]|nr:hypothetical protein [Deltaproteobacteria bacterium]